MQYVGPAAALILVAIAAFYVGLVRGIRMVRTKLYRINLNLMWQCKECNSFTKMPSSRMNHDTNCPIGRLGA